MREKFPAFPAGFLLAGSFGVYLSCTLIFGLGVMLPTDNTPLFSPGLMLAFGAAWHFLRTGWRCLQLPGAHFNKTVCNAGTGAGKVSAAFPHLSALRS